MNQSQQIMEILGEAAPGELKVGDEVAVQMKHVTVTKAASGAPVWMKSLKAEIKAGGGTVFVVGIEQGGQTVNITGKKGGRGSTMLGPVGISPSALTKVG